MKPRCGSGLKLALGVGKGSVRPLCESGVNLALMRQETVDQASL